MTEPGIECPYCKHTGSTVNETKNFPGFKRRYRTCTKCKKGYTTEETVAVYGGKSIGMVRNLLPVLEADE